MGQREGRNRVHVVFGNSVTPLPGCLGASSTQHDEVRADAFHVRLVTAIGNPLVRGRMELDVADEGSGALAPADQLASRLRTKLRLALLLGARQKAFLVGEEPAPGPLTLREAGNRMGLAPSTVQRAAASTWAVTPRGTLLLCSLTGRGLSARPDMTSPFW